MFGKFQIGICTKMSTLSAIVLKVTKNFRFSNQSVFNKHGFQSLHYLHHVNYFDKKRENF